MGKSLAGVIKLMVTLLVGGSVSHSLAPPAVQILSCSTFMFSVEREKLLAAGGLQHHT